MKLTFHNDYISIKSFNPVLLPDFTVLTGLNGVGKSHLLKAIELGSVKIDNISQNEIAYFNYNDFIVDSKITDNQNDINTFNSKVSSNKARLFQVYQEKKQQIINKIQGFDPLDFSLATMIMENISLKAVFGGSSLKLDNLKAKGSDLPQKLLTLTDNNELGIEKYLFDFSKNYVSRGGDLFSLKFDEIKIRFAEINKKLLGELEQDRTYYAFLKRNTSRHKNIFNLAQEDFENISLFAFEISEEIKNYKIEYQENQNTKKYTNREFIDKFGKDPLATINDVLGVYDCNGYSINSENFVPSYKRDNLKAVVPITLRHKIDQYETTLDQISSGEKTLMAIAFMIYKLKKGRVFPRVLLLDEIDSALHPSMTKRLLNVVLNLFVKKNQMKVIFVTHSPTTVALAPDNAIYVVNKNGLNKLEKRSKEDALQILSEGYASLSQAESDYSISYMVQTSNKNSIVLTEGITDKIILETAWNKLNKKKMPFYIQDCFDASFLSSLIKRGEDPQDGIFVKYPDKSFVAIFDFDKTGYNSWNNINSFDIVEDDPEKCMMRKHKTLNEYAILLPVPKNKVVQKQVINSGKLTFAEESHLPIELLFYGSKKLKKYFKFKNSSGGGKYIEFSYDKRKFADFVKTLPKGDFKNFVAVFENLKTIFGNN